MDLEDRDLDEMSRNDFRRYIQRQLVALKADAASMAFEVAKIAGGQKWALTLLAALVGMLGAVLAAVIGLLIVVAA